MRASEKAYDLIKCFESFRPRPYICAGGVYTIGYGHTRFAHYSQEITHSDAIELLKTDVTYFESRLREMVLVPLNQNQFDALVSFLFNIGERKFRDSTLLKLLNAGAYEAAGKQLLRWQYAGGVILRGLRQRRKAELALYETPVRKEAA